MKILVLADQESKYYYDYYTPGRLSEIDLIISCGDLRREYLEFMGLQMHIGSQLFENDAFLDGLNIVMDWVDILKKELGVVVKEVDFGGGFGARYTDEVRKPYRFFLDPMMELMKKRSEEIGIPCPTPVIEPGRSIVAEAGLTLYSSIVAEAGLTLYTVGQIKEIKGVRKYISIDGGMGDNIRVGLYQAEYEGIVANRAEEERDDKVCVCGRYCESTDIIMTDVMVPHTTRMGDILATFSTGAYGFSMASNYNNNPIPGVVLVRDGKSAWMVKPQTYAQIAQNQVVPDIL